MLARANNDASSRSTKLENLLRTRSETYDTSLKTPVRTGARSVSLYEQLVREVVSRVVRKLSLSSFDGALFSLSVGPTDRELASY